MTPRSSSRDQGLPPSGSGEGLPGGDQRFRDVEYVGRGSMGAVYRAVDAELGTTVAIKTIVDAGPDWIYRLKREFRSLRGVVHRNLVQLYDLVVSDDSCFFTMESIEGVDFAEHVRAGGDLPLEAALERFRAAAPQLCEGVRALHAAGHLHRDIKPGNLKVDPSGRVVLLDFDLVTPLGRALPTDFASAAFAGTLAYMAPEQRMGLPIGAAADWYAVGVVLYESLTGELPLDEGARARLTRPAQPVPLRVRVPEIPGWLAALVEALLASDPGKRPSGDEVLACLEGERPPDAVGEARPAPHRGPHVGRERELARLDALYHGDGTVLAAVHGSSGIGKTELVRTFLEGLPEAPVPLVLSGRCNPQESVAYQALDAVVDGLSRHLLSREDPLPDVDGREAAALTVLFPVLARVPALAERRRDVTVVDVVEIRRLAIRTLRTLLRSAASSRRVVVWVDDVQWSDVDSGRLLREVLRPPDAPPLLLLLTYRSEDRERIPMLAVLREDEASGLDLREIEILPLDATQAAALAGQLCASRPLRPEETEAIVSGAQGSPFLIHEMVRHLESRWALGGSTGERVDLSNVVSDRLGELEPDERRLLELVSLCGQPAERGLLLRAAGLGAGGGPLIARLEGRSLVQVQVDGGEQGVQAYHDRIREAISGELPDDRRVRHHGDLAEVFESSGRVEPDVLAHHFHGARQLPRAADYGVAAADKAAEALAFERAAELYRSAREWDPRTPPWRRSLHGKEAECLANAARLVDAGREYLAASRDAPRLEALELRRRGSEHLLGGGAVEQGTAALTDLLRDLGIAYPASTRSALLRTVWTLLKLLARSVEPTRSTGLDEEERIRIDTCFGTGKSLVDMDALRGLYFSMLSLERALRSGDRYRTARSLGVVGGVLSLIDGLSARGSRMMQAGLRLAEELQAPELIGTLAVAEGQVLMMHGLWQRARDRSAQGVKLLSEGCRGFAFECNIGRGMLLRSLEEIGEDLREIAERAQQYHEATSAANDRYAETGAVQHLSFAAMAADDPAAARRFAVRGASLWDREGFHVQHLYTARALALCDLYEARPRASWERFREMGPALRRSSLMRLPLVRVDVHSLCGQLALAMAHIGGGDREELLRACERSAGQLDREPRPDARAHAGLLRAGVATLRGRDESALPHLDEALAACEQGGMVLRSTCALLRKGQLLGGDAGRGCAVEAQERMREIGVAEPQRWAAMYALGFDAAEPRAPAA